MLRPRCFNSTRVGPWKPFGALTRTVSALFPADLSSLRVTTWKAPTTCWSMTGAKAKDLKVGDTYNVLNHDWRVVGIVEHGKGARLFVPLTTLQNLVGARDKASIFLVICTRPEHTDAVMEEMRHLLPGYTVRPLKDFLSLMTATNIPGLQSFISAMIALAVSIGLLVIFLTMYTTVIERTRDIGVLKSLGANHWFVIRSLLSESAALCVLGV